MKESELNKDTGQLRQALITCYTSALPEMDESLSGRSEAAVNAMVKEMVKVFAASGERMRTFSEQLKIEGQRTPAADTCIPYIDAL